jgi:hypothetical protein
MTSPSSGTPSPTSIPDYLSNAKYEDIACRPIKPLYDCTEDNLVPFLNRLDIYYHDEGWGPITYINVNNMKHDLIEHFSKIDETVILWEANFWWSAATVEKDKH